MTDYQIEGKTPGTVFLWNARESKWQNAIRYDGDGSHFSTCHNVLQEMPSALDAADGLSSVSIVSYNDNSGEEIERVSFAIE